MTGAAALPAIFLMFLLSRWSGGLVTRYGPRIPLIMGPLITAAAFLLFTLPSVRANYWTTLLPGFLVLGLGMAISVAPLTTVVMTSVEQDLAGTASGINNAVARVAGVLAVAVLGVVMVAAFAHSLSNSLAGLHLGADVVAGLESNVVKLGSLDVPTNQKAETRKGIQIAISQAFVFAFRIVMVICACLAAMSAAVAFRMISVAGAQTIENSG